jgi:ABC-type multidrug transport system fused ATPase/permease subunit
MAPWREMIAWVPQRPTLFRGTVAENIRFADPAASEERVRAAATLAGADRFIEELPDGYHTVVGEGGRTLSSGERRRIGLARAFIRDAPLLVLDEPTADLDLQSIEVVSGAVQQLAEGRTTLLITHRPELIRFADRVVRLSSGRVVDEVSPDAATQTERRAA